MTAIVKSKVGLKLEAMHIIDKCKKGLEYHFLHADAVIQFWVIGWMDAGLSWLRYIIAANKSHDTKGKGALLQPTLITKMRIYEIEKWD